MRDDDKDKKRIKKRGEKSYEEEYERAYEDARAPEGRVTAYSNPDGDSLQERIAKLETKMTFLLGASGLTFVVIVSVAFWLGSTLSRIDTTLAQSSQKTDRVYEVVLTNSDSLNARTKVIETKLDDIDKKLPSR